MTIKLYDLCGANKDVRFSPFCWLAKFGLLHKGLAFEAIPINFTPKSDYPDPDYGKLPVLRDDDVLIKDSMEIIRYLDNTYPGNPLLTTEAERAAADFYNAWLGAALFPGLGPLLFKRVHDILIPEDQEYFRTTREKRFGVTLEELASAEGAPEKVSAALSVLAVPLSNFDFLGGQAPNLADYIVASPLMWKRSVTPEKLFETPVVVDAWMDRILDLHDGYGRRSTLAVAAR